MKAYVLFIGIILLLLMILLALDRTRNLEEAFGVIPSASQSSYLSSDIPGAVTANPIVTKPTTKEVIDAQETVRMFMELCQTTAKQSITQKQTCINLKFRAPIFMNELDALLGNPEIVNASHFYKTLAEYKQAVQQLKQVPSQEGFANETTVEKDIANLLDAISIFEETLAMKDMQKINLANDRNFVSDLHVKAQQHSVKVQTPPIPRDPEFRKRVQLLTSDYQRGLYILSELPNKVPVVAQSTGSVTSDKITLQGVKDLIQNIQAEQLRLQNLRSTDSTMLARIRLLEQLLADLREIVRKVEMKEMKVEEIPIKASDATEFLAQYKSAEKLPYLMEQSGAPVTNQNVFSQPHEFNSGTEATLLPLQQENGSLQTRMDHRGGPSGPMIPAELLKYLKNLKWSMEIKVHNDPGIAYRERTMNRIKELEQRIAAYAYNDVPIPFALQRAFKQELEALSMAITRDYSNSDDMYSNYNHTDEDSEDSDDLEDSDGVSYKAYKSKSAKSSDTPRTYRLDSSHTRIHPDNRDGDLGDYNPFNNKDKSNPDAMVRPGFIMNDETIKHRGSAAYFDDSTVGGLDYKQRSKDLCRQIKSANLGEPATFGCIENPEAVSSTYSWKGNFEMICNRLGDTWGGWYPEMFGCPKYDPTMKYSGAQL